MPMRGDFDLSGGGTTTGSFVHKLFESGVQSGFDSRQKFVEHALKMIKYPEWNGVDIDDVRSLIDVFWERNKSDKKKNFLLALDNVKLSNIHVRFDNRALKINATGLVRRSSFKGQFSRESYSMSAGLDGVLEHYSNEGTVLFKEQNSLCDAIYIKTLF